MRDLIVQFQKITAYVLIVLMAVVIGFSTINLVVLVFNDLVHYGLEFLQQTELKILFGLFLLILLAFELLEMIKVYLEDNVFQVEVVYLAAIIAVVRKILLLDIEKTEPNIFFGIGFVVLSLAGGLYLIRKKH
jgi:uncharacterized membrane protein (DUF373 family)